LRAARRGPAEDDGDPRAARRAPGRPALLAFLLREDIPALVAPRRAEAVRAALAGAAAAVFDTLVRRGASFLPEIARAARLLPAQAEAAMWELVARGLVSSDGMAGLRSLLRREGRRRRGRGEMGVGRWSLWGVDPDAEAPREARLQVIARQLLRRYGVVFREVLGRESAAPPWRDLLPVYRRWEAAGEIRGGRFVDGMVGEQYAAPGAVEALRAVRREPADGRAVVVSAADPLNLVGILTPGPRVPSGSGDLIVYRDGVPVTSGPLGAVRGFLQPAEPVA
jgi:ATP-dependent Lhr-like helicase